MEIFLTVDGVIALMTLAFLEIVLGVDNIIFISIVSNKLPKEQQAKARNIGLLLALIFRIALLFGITWIIKFTQPIFTIDLFDFTNEISGRDLILAIGGLFLLAKSTSEIHHKIEGKEDGEVKQVKAVMSTIILQIVFLDVIFSFDSILTAVGLTDHVELMIAAVIISMLVMMSFAGKISSFINNNPTLQILALSFLILIGFTLIMEALDQHVPKGYIYFSVFFSLLVEVLNMKMRKRKPQATTDQKGK